MKKRKKHTKNGKLHWTIPSLKKIRSLLTSNDKRSLGKLLKRDRSRKMKMSEAELIRKYGEHTDG
jgi:hypothetical protein